MTTTKSCIVTAYLRCDQNNGERSEVDLVDELRKSSGGALRSPSMMQLLRDRNHLVLDSEVNMTCYKFVSRLSGSVSWEDLTINKSHKGDASDQPDTLEICNADSGWTLLEKMYKKASCLCVALMGKAFD